MLSTAAGQATKAAEDMTSQNAISDRIFHALADTSGDGGLSSAAQAREPVNFLRHVLSLAMTKTADGLMDPKLVLSWLLQSLGASSLWVGLLVPVREAGALLPQLFTAKRIHALSRRKWAWAAGSSVQGLAAAGIALAGVTLAGDAAGAGIVLLLAVLALARSVCSVSYKDVLGKTVGKSRRGTATGLASSLASAAVIAFALVLTTGLAARYGLVIGALALASALWLTAAAVFAGLDEEPSETRQPSGGLHAVLAQLSVLGEDPQLVRFIAARGLLVGTALAPPFLVVLAAEAGQGTFRHLGALVLASSTAALVSGYVWGRLADRSSRRVLVYSGMAATTALTLAVLADLAGLFASPWITPVLLFALMLAYNGVRQGRSTHLVDMAPAEQRAQYAAVSNTVIGVILLASGLFGALASVAGAIWAIGVFAVISAAGSAVALTLREVQTD